MAKTKLLGFEMEGMPTVMENAEKMARARVRIIDAKHNMIAQIKARRAIAGKVQEMKNVTPIATDDDVIDVGFKEIEAPKKEAGTSQDKQDGQDK